ncbi:MAG TPA: hypothetical protein PKI98_07130 [Chitinophagaceae bacterium]|nr:hypothetical protein [Chitinophagaceae bacterium]MCC6635629.1 hypothetical protein [Chitinophagaceae bacterium]HNM34644.1 hypothetical protein [Chitinophagaceae bacterium]
MSHTFHIPVLGTAYSIETPIKVAHLGISSVISIVDDILVERLRKFYSQKVNLNYQPITKKDIAFRSKRITAYLNLVHKMVEAKVESMKQECFEKKGELVKYFELLPEHSALKKMYIKFIAEENSLTKQKLEQELKQNIVQGAIDVNIMSKVDKLNLNKEGEVINSDALESFKGFADSTLNAAVVLSAGMNPKLYNYIENFSDFFPDENNQLRKRIILKVSDFRSALIQAKFLAKKGLWVSEFRVESGLNCGGHAFATDGLLTGPILEEFKQNRNAMLNELFEMYQKALETKNINCNVCPTQKITYQGGIGNHEEDIFLQQFYQLDGTGWGSPFLLVPEATTVDEATLNNLAKATKDDFYISGSSPLGVPFNNFKLSSSEKQRIERIEKGRPGSPCIKKLLVSNTEFTKEPICTASRQYQNLKIKQLQEQGLNQEEYQEQFNIITEKACLCEGLATAAYINNDIVEKNESTAVAICPGPNTAYFNKIYSLNDMVKHIYGKINLLDGVKRSNMYINELHLYIEYIKKDINHSIKNLNDKKIKYYNKFKEQLENGITYYKNIIPQIFNQSEAYKKQMLTELDEAVNKINQIFSILSNTEEKQTKVA